MLVLGTSTDQRQFGTTSIDAIRGSSGNRAVTAAPVTAFVVRARCGSDTTIDLEAGSGGASSGAGTVD